jgi:TolB-like protein
MKTIKLVFIVMISILITINVFSNNTEHKKIRVAVLNFSTKGDINPNVADAVVENLITSLIDSGYFEVVERNQLNAGMQELKLQSSDDFNDNIRKELGKLYGVEMVILGSVTKIGNNITINTRGIEVESGNANFAKNLITDSENNIPYLIPLLVDIISGKKIDVKALDQDKIKEIQNETSKVIEDKKIENKKEVEEEKLKEVAPDNAKDKILLGKLEGWDNESKTFYMDEVKNLKDPKFREIIIETEKNSVKIKYFKIWFDDWDDDLILDKNIALGNEINNFSVNTTNKKGEARVVKKIKIKFDVDDDSDENAIVNIYGIK